MNLGLMAVFCVFGVRSIVVKASVPADGRGQCDGYRYYYDHGTDLCELCSEICQYAKIQGTEEQCRNNCPRYLRAMECEGQVGWYYDELHDSCKSCCDLCGTANISPECTQKCPDFLIHPASKQAPCHLHNEAVENPSIDLQPCDWNTQGQTSTNDLHRVWIVIIVAMVVGFTIVLVAVGIIAITRSRRYAPVRQRERDAAVNGRDVHRAEAVPVEERAAGLPTVAVVAADGAIRSMTVPVKTAFADLSERQDTSRCELV